MNVQIESNHTFLDIDYNNMTLNNIIKFKINLLDVLNVIKRWKTVGNSNTSEFDNFTKITSIAYGYIDNPYGNVISDIIDMKHKLENISYNISEYWILDKISYLNTKQTFNIDILIQTSPYSKNTIEEWVSIVNKFDNAVKLYNKACLEKNEILKKALRCDVTDKKTNGFYYKSVENNVEKIEHIKNGKLVVKSYHFGHGDYGSSNWFIYHNKETTEFNKFDKKYEFIWKQECPELYLT